ncbi:hypothetical protein WJX84_008907 [Apatococcus fuscideae]|uniref:TauD/TfdA-like domain-containing protein n=1 Tax=Apatococcus fuscideae TaxID=2026836 RepID=A0AAW1SXI2_9CHLO
MLDQSQQPADVGLSPLNLTQASLAADIGALQRLAAKAQPVVSAEVSGPQGNVRPLTIVQDPSAWMASDFTNGSAPFIYQLSETDILELRTSVAAALDQGVPQEGNLLKLHEKLIGEADFPLPKLGPKLKAMRENLRSGRGFQLIRGVPVHDWSNRESVIAYFGIGLYLGKVNSQNRKGHLVGHIKDIGHDLSNPMTRLYATNGAQPFHCDMSDIVGLLCLKRAKQGGDSSWSSAISVHNELLKRGRQDLVEELAKDQWYLDRKGEIPAGKLPYYRIPIFNYHQGYLSVNYSATYYELAQRHPEVPRLTEKQKEALSYFNALARSDDLRMDWTLQPGDIQLLYNHTMLHNRTAFTDHEDYNERRHLLRLWVSPQGDRELPECYADLWGSITPGNRGGIIIPGEQPTVPIEAE